MRSVLKIIKGNPFFETLYHSKNFFISNISVKALGFISLPVMTRLLTPSDYGVLNVFGTWQAIFVSLLTLNCYGALGRYYYEKQDDLKYFLGTLSVFIFFLLFISLIFFSLFKHKMHEILGLPENTINYIVPLILFSVLGLFFEQIYVPQRQSKKIAIRNVLNSYGGFGIAVLLIIFLEKDKYLGQIYASLITGILFSLYYLFELKPYFKLSFNIKFIKYSLAYSLPLLPYSLSGVILAQFDRVMVNNYNGSSDAGLYSFAYNIGMLLTIVLSSLHLAWAPDYFKHMDDKNHAQLDSDIQKFIRIIMASALFLILFGKEIGMILAKSNYHTSLVIVPIIVIGYIFYSFFTFYAWNLQYAKKNIYLSFAVLLAGIINIVLNIIFIPKYGYMAAAYTTTVSYIIMALITHFVSHNILKLYTTPLRLVCMPLIIMIPFVIAYYMLICYDISLLLSIIVKMLLLGSFVLVLFYRYAKKVFV